VAGELLLRAPAATSTPRPEAVTFPEQPPPITTLGVTHLPPNEIASNDPTAFVRVAIDPGDGALGADRSDVDDLWIYYLGDGSDYSHVFVGEGVVSVVGEGISLDRTPILGSVHNNLFIDQPNPPNLKPRIYVGTQAHRSDAFNPGWPTVKAFGAHPVSPAANRLHAITTGAAYRP
jgi:hypothetical protein